MKGQAESYPSLEGTLDPKSNKALARVADEAVWELVRDEWELLLAIGSGPTTPKQAAVTLRMPEELVEAKLHFLKAHQIVSEEGNGYRLVQAFYERREGMSSYLKDLVFSRLMTDGPVRALGLHAVMNCGNAHEMEKLILAAEDRLFPEIVAAASVPESPHSERFLVLCVLSDMLESKDHLCPKLPTESKLLSIIKSAAVARSRDRSSRSNYLWIAEMRCDLSVAQAIAISLRHFLDDAYELAPSPHDDGHGPGALCFAVLPQEQLSAVQDRGSDV